MTGPGRPGREQQASLTALAAAQWAGIARDAVYYYAFASDARSKAGGGMSGFFMGCPQPTSMHVGAIYHGAVQSKHVAIGL